MRSARTRHRAKNYALIKEFDVRLRGRAGQHERCEKSQNPHLLLKSGGDAARARVRQRMGNPARTADASAGEAEDGEQHVRVFGTHTSALHRPTAQTG